MSEKIVLLNAWHNSLDDRVFYHQAKSLSKSGYEVQIISTKDDTIEVLDNISINSFSSHQLTRSDKIKKIIENLTVFSPRLIICDSPLAVFASKSFKKTHPVKIIYDITEWYPSKIQLQYYKGVHKIFRFFVLLLVNFSAGIKSDSFIFGEYYKSIAFRKIFFWKKHIKLPYFPETGYIRYYPLEKITSDINFLYSGKITAEKGIDSVIGAIKLAGLQCPDKQFRLKIIGNFPHTEDQTLFNSWISDVTDNVHVTVIDTMPFPEFCKTIGNTHLFFDLRKRDFENIHCLPIKLFYYLGCGRPVIYSDLKAIRKEIKNINFGYLCNPADVESIAWLIVNYIKHPETYIEHASNALEIYKSAYNWKAIEKGFISFVENQG